MASSEPERDIKQPLLESPVELYVNHVITKRVTRKIYFLYKINGIDIKNTTSKGNCWRLWSISERSLVYFQPAGDEMETTFREFPLWTFEDNTCFRSKTRERLDSVSFFFCTTLLTYLILFLTLFLFLFFCDSLFIFHFFCLKEWSHWVISKLTKKTNFFF